MFVTGVRMQIFSKIIKHIVSAVYENFFPRTKEMEAQIPYQSNRFRLTDAPDMGLNKLCDEQGQ